jgi:hypothetical protein
VTRQVVINLVENRGVLEAFPWNLWNKNI